MTSLQVKADSVKTAVASTSTCTSTTVSLLSDLLSTKTNTQISETLANSRPNLKGKSAAKPRTARPSKPGSINVVAHENGKSSGGELSPKEKAILATEVINATLKSLNNAGKALPSIKQQTSSFDVKDSPRRKALRRSTSFPQSPLQERSLNRIISSPNITTRSSRSSSSVSTNSSAYRATAECSRLAFACMRALQSSKTPCTMDLPPLQLENGMSALIGKLILLGLDELATKELRILKRRLDGLSKGLDQHAPSKKRQSDSVHTQETKEANQNLADLMDFEVPPTQGVVLLAITSQLQVLKLLASSRKPNLITDVLPKLHPEYKSSPIRLLLQMAQESSAQATKAARQLEIVSQLILSLCPNISTSDDTIALASKLSTSPAVALQLQTLAFHSRLLWWKLGNHQGDIENDVLLPFSRCLTAFTRRSQYQPLGTYQNALQAFGAIQSALADYSKSKVKDVKSPLRSIHRLLGSLAQDADRFDDAIRWLKMVKESFGEAPVSELQRCAVATSLITLKLLTSEWDREVEELLMLVLKGLEGPLKGDSLELDELLSELSKARRAAILQLYKRVPGSNDTTAGAVSDVERGMCESLILLCPRFSTRYLGKPPDSGSAPKVIVRYEQRRQFLAKSAFHAIDSAVYLMKAFQSEGRLTWELLDSTLQDCLRLLERIGSKTQDFSEECATAAASSYFVRISQLYFAQHLNMRRDAEGPKDMQHLRPLRRSIDCLSSRSLIEKKAASINLKLERLADAYKMVGRYDDARGALVALHKELIDAGVLSRVAAAGCNKSLGEVWHECDENSMLARTISSLMKLELKLGLKVLHIPIYDVTWSVQERGTVLEYLLDALSRQSRESQTVQRDIFLELLTVYDLQRFPIRRLRVIPRLLKLDPDRRRNISDDVKNTLAISKVVAVIERSEDIGLISYLPHLQAFASTVSELQEDHPRVDLLMPHLASWYSILETLKDYENLTKRVDEVPELISHLLFMADFLQMKGYGKVRIAVLRMIANLNEIPRPDSCPDDLVLSYNSLGLQYLELGYSGKAGLSLDRAQSYALRNGVTPEALIQVHLSYAEYLLAIGNLAKCEEALLRAQAVALQNPEISSPLKASGNLQRKNHLAGLAAYAFLVQSLLASERGAAETALSHAKRNVKLIRYSWVKIAIHMKPKAMASESIGGESLAEDVLKSSVLTSSPLLAVPPYDQLPGPSAWALVGPLFKGLSHLSTLYAHNGMFQETIYYAEQAHKLVQLIDSRAYLATALTATGATWLNAGKLDKASEFFVKAKEFIVSSCESQTTVVLNCQLARLHGLLSNREAMLAAYNHAYNTLETMSSTKYMADIDRISNPTAILEEEMSRLSLKISKPTKFRKGVAARKASNKKNVIQSKSLDEVPISISDECIRLASLKGFLLRQKADAFMTWKRCEEAVAILKEADAYSRRDRDIIDQHMSNAKQLLLLGVDQMSADPVYSVLQDSTISFPAVMGCSKLATFTSDRSSGMRVTPPRKHQSSQSARENHHPKSPPPSSFFDKLRQAQDCLTGVYSVAVRLSSTVEIHSLSSLLCAINILLSAAGPHLGKATAHPNLATCSMEKSMNIALKRERKCLFNDQGTATQDDDELRWPIIPVADCKGLTTDLAADALRFQKEYIDIIPQGWTCVSISLSQNRQELCLTKMQAGHSSFMLRLPLGRNNSRDVDEEVFDFNQGKAELLEIIELANDNSHGAKDLSGRGEKTAWWAEREELDARLKDLLNNIENVWLGGFKGIFSQHRPRPDMLVRFQKSFQNILDKHLPSRQSGNKKTKNARVTLDSRVLELFIGLKDASAEDCDLDEALTDLLYFVIDIFQFHGERNAYDEIDFDSLVIETHDALKSYHEATLAASTSNEGKHTILILDKALHAFPWESLPCMDGLAVSRLPSLECLKERILGQQNSSAHSGPERHYVDALNGSYILNPGGDLKTTQTTFETDLQGLSTWSGIIKREPTELEMRESLENKDIFLYFGHGSGAQYIRSKAIKRLRKCAVTMLMGCSSGALTEAGEFEPYGPPIDYMIAGCPALVATLWDVTDKDIDRFAKSTFENWGLFDHQLAGIEQSSKAKGKRVAGPPPLTRGEKKSLVRAVAEGRKACNFRYLTAAAVCIYGIPVYLK